MPWNIYRNNSKWVPPLIKERLDLLSSNHPYFEHANVRFWLATLDGNPVGRVSAQVDQLSPNNESDRIGYFGMFECINDQSLAQELLGRAEDWLNESGRNIVRGPFSLSINQESGLLVDGFDTEPFFMMGHAQPYYQALLSTSGYRKAKDLYAWFNKTDFKRPSAMQRLLERYDQRIVIRDLDTKQVKQELKLVLEIFNDAWTNNWGFIPFTEKEFLHLGSEMLQFFPPEYFKIAEYDQQSVGMIVTLPNINELIKDLNGKLLPTGILKLLWRLKFAPPSSGRVPLLGIKQKYQNQLVGSAIAFMLIGEMQQTMLANGLVTHEMSWVLEDNVRLNKILESLGGYRYKTYRVFEKQL